MYREAFMEQLQMLKGEKPIDFKRAIFITENAFHNGELDYITFCQDIEAIGKQLKSLIKERGLSQYKTSGNWAVYSYMNDSLPINNYQPFTYDFEDFSGEKDFTKMFVTKLIRTKKGNCNSLPTYYKILCEEIGANAYLALAHNHLYVKHKDEEGKWVNLELTNGGFPRDEWVIHQLGITVEAIKKETYMKPLTQKESIVLAIHGLLNAYHFKYQYDEFMLEVINEALKYFPNFISIHMIKANCYLYFGLEELKKDNPDKKFLKSNYIKHQACVDKINELGYKELPKELYDEWVRSLEAEKKRRGLNKKI